MYQIKRAIKKFLPQSIVTFARQYRTKRAFKEYESLSTREIFSKIYNDGIWGGPKDPAQPFFSGSGSHSNIAVTAYVNAVQNFLSGWVNKPDVVDLGCGDFAVGAKIRSFCRNYIACDVVPELIAFNKEKFNQLDVDFRALDIAIEKLPDGDVVFIRQVFQHMSNEQIHRVLTKVLSTYKYLILTEHLPQCEQFKHNIDKPAGPGIRTGLNSGVVLESPPFNIEPMFSRLLCQAEEDGGLIVTKLYKFNDAD